VNLAGEGSKAGVSPDELSALFDAVSRFENLQIEGLMSLPPFLENAQQMRPFHARLRELRDGLNANLMHLSMGMSNDFEVAIEEGATLVRVGTALFGGRG
jgi:hypothetical protein